MSRRAAVGRTNTTVGMTPPTLLDKVAKQRRHQRSNTDESPLAQSSRGVLKRGRGSRLAKGTGFKFSQNHKLISLPLPYYPRVCFWPLVPFSLLHWVTEVSVGACLQIRSRSVVFTVSSSFTENKVDADRPAGRHTLLAFIIHRVHPQ